jgi:hypothetical protein
MKSPPGRFFSMPQEHSRLKLSGAGGCLAPQGGRSRELWVKDANGTINLFDQIRHAR